MRKQLYQTSAKWFFIFICLTVFASCINEEICEEAAANPVRVGFYFNDTVAAIPPRLLLDSLVVFGLGQDSLLYPNRNNVGQIDLPLNPTSDSTAFVLSWFRPDVYPQQLFDTIWFNYRRNPILISIECGFVTFYNLTDVRYSGTLIDSLIIEVSNIRNTIDEHIKIFPVFIPADTP